MTLKQLNKFKRLAEKAYSDWEESDVFAWEVDSRDSWRKTYIAVKDRDRATLNYRAALKTYQKSHIAIIDY
jgi:hypothetical protein